MVVAQRRNVSGKSQQEALEEDLARQMRRPKHRTTVQTKVRLKFIWKLEHGVAFWAET